MNENIKNLVELIEKHPERKVIAMVEFEVVGSDDFSRWLGYIGKVKLEEIYQWEVGYMDKCKSCIWYKETFKGTGYCNMWDIYTKEEDTCTEFEEGD